MVSPALRRRSFLWWVCLILFFALGGPTLYERWHRSRLEKNRWRTASEEINEIRQALEAYRNRRGYYPRPLGGSADPVVQAKMLYQAVTGDGTDFIDGVSPSSSPSTGQLGKDGEVYFQPSPTMIRESALVDPWQRPYHYVRGDEHNETLDPDAFDLWSDGGEGNGIRPSGSAD